MNLERWEILPLTLKGRIETITMNILPRLLFLFQSLLIMIPSATFKRLDKNILSFYGRIRRQDLNISPKNRGLILPKLGPPSMVEQSVCPKTPLESLHCVTGTNRKGIRLIMNALLEQWKYGH